MPFKQQEEILTLAQQATKTTMSRHLKYKKHRNALPSVVDHVHISVDDVHTALGVALVS